MMYCRMSTELGVSQVLYFSGLNLQVHCSRCHINFRKQTAFWWWPLNPFRKIRRRGPKNFQHIHVHINTHLQPRNPECFADVMSSSYVRINLEISVTQETCRRTSSFCSLCGCFCAEYGPPQSNQSLLLH